MKTTFELIYDVVRKIPRGCVATYGQIATLAGNPRWSRVVGYALHVNPEPGVIPCHRVVNRLGETSSAFAFGGEDMQKTLFEHRLHKQHIERRAAADAQQRVLLPFMQYNYQQHRQNLRYAVGSA